MKRTNIKTNIVALLLGLVTSQTSDAFHLDVSVWVANGQVQSGFCLDASLGCDTLSVATALGLPNNQLPVDKDNGRSIFLTDFGDLAGGAYSTDDPGFQALPGWLPSNQLLQYRAIEPLQYWDPNNQTWGFDAPGNPQIRLFGGLSAQTIISTDTSHCGGLLICIPRQVQQTVYNQGSTVFTEQGVAGANSLIIDNIGANGSLHSHLDWFLEQNNGTPGGAAGAYLVALAMTTSGYQDSSPFYILFNNGLTAPDLVKAINARTQVEPVPLPGAQLLMASALAMFGWQRRK